MEWLPSITTLLMVVPLLLALAIWLLLLLLQPICVFVDCLCGKLPLGKKTIWLALMILSLGLATTIYPYLVSESRFLRTVTFLTYLPFLFLLLLYLSLYFFNPDFKLLMDSYFLLIVNSLA